MMLPFGLISSLCFLLLEKLSTFFNMPHPSCSKCLLIVTPYKTNSFLSMFFVWDVAINLLIRLKALPEQYLLQKTLI